MFNPFQREENNVPLLREAFADWSDGNGIFNALSNLGVDLPWGELADATMLDIEYFGNHSGAKLSAPLVVNLLNGGDQLTEQQMEILARVIWTKFNRPWVHLWATNVVEYNPIHNYNMTDQRELIRGESEARAIHDSSVDTTAHGRTSESKDYVSGLNSTDEIGKFSGRSVSEEGGTTGITGTGDRKDDSVKAANERETTTRSGNIGVTTTQQMLTAERDLWIWNYFDQIYKDVDSVLALTIYDPCRI